MATISDDLAWQLTRKASCFRRHSRIGGGVDFSAERDNLRNSHSRKYSGVARSKAVGLQYDTAKQTVVMTVKAKAGKQRKPAQQRTVQNVKSDRKLAVRGVSANTNGNYYRRDLGRDALARLERLRSLQKERKVAVTKRWARSRGKKTQ